MKKKGKTHRCHAVELRELLGRPDCKADEVLQAKLPGMSVFAFSDGSVLVQFSDKRGIVWHSREELLTGLAALDPEPRHVLKGMLPSGRDFVNQAHHLANGFAEHRELPPVGTAAADRCLR